MHKNVEILIGRLVTDATLRRRFAANPAGTLLALHVQGLELTALERRTLACLDIDALVTFAGTLDGRLRKATPIHPMSKEIK
jgi:hypothetical protein